ncbi:hypothetical protein HYV82_03650 [Candidatus Woesearchaeota archaeon]|nr:hypothetical protein [Candidatus Woesearchaeota archaeon]
MGIVSYFRAEPTEYVRFSSGGKTIGEGTGIGRHYLRFNTSIELVPVNVAEKPFDFREMSANKQEVILQGGFLYRIAEPRKVLGEYNFAIDPGTRDYLSEDPEKLPDHVLEIARANARRCIQEKTLEELLGMSEELSEHVMGALNASPVVKGLGISVMAVYFSAPQAQPDIAKALGAEYREGLLKLADAATYGRRAAAVEQDRIIKRAELKTEHDLERGRKQLIELQGGNATKKAEYEAAAARLGLAPFDAHTPAKLAALALYELGRRGNVGNLTITTELLAALRDAG